METVLAVSIGIVAVVLWVIYHKIFNVIYFDLSRGCLKEIAVCIILAYMLISLFIAIPWLGIITIAIIVLIIVAKIKNG